MKDKIVKILKVISKALPYLIAMIGGGTVAATVSGCKIGSLVSLSTPL